MIIFFSKDFKGLRLFFLSNFREVAFIPGATFITFANLSTQGVFPDLLNYLRLFRTLDIFLLNNSKTLPGNVINP